MNVRLLLVFCLILFIVPSVSSLPDRSTLFSAGETITARNIEGFEMSDLNGNSGELDFILFDNTASDEKFLIFCRNTVPGGPGWTNDLNLLIPGGFIIFSVLDVNGDSFPEIVGLDTTNNNIVTYLNTGAGCSNAFENDRNVLSPTGTIGSLGSRQFTPFDYDQNGTIDLILFENALLRFYTGDGKGAFTPVNTESTQNFNGHYVGVGDFNQSTWLSIYAPNSVDNRYFINTNELNGINFDLNRTTDIPGVQAFMFDLNYDGFPDVVSHHSSGNFKLSSTMNIAGILQGEDFNAGYENGAAFDSPQTKSWGADFDNDGNVDSVQVDQDLVFWFGTGTPEFKLDLNILSASGNGGSLAYPIDLNNDGAVDVVIKDGGTNTIIIFDNNSQGFTNSAPTTPSGDLNTSCSADFLTFEWPKSTDAQTPSNGLTYNIRVGTFRGGNDIIASHDGWPWKGNMLSRTKNTINIVNRGIDCDTVIFWAVQSIDAGLLRSDFTIDQVNDVVQVTFKDENTGVRIVPDSILIDNNIFTADANGVLQFNVEDFENKEFQMKVSDSNYGERVFILDLNRSQGLAFTARLLEKAAGQDINFQFFKPNGIDLFTNGLVTVKTSDGDIASIRRLGKNADTNFFLNPNDPGYTFEIKEADNNVTTYGETQLIISRPKDEITQEDLNWSLNVGGVGAKSFSGLTGDLNFAILNNTADFYILTVDGNSEYSSRFYAIKVKGDDVNTTLQPFLLRTSDGTSVIIRTIDVIDETTIRGVLVESRRFISGSGTVIVESLASDGSGTVDFDFEAGIEYTLSFTIFNQIVFITTYIPISTDTTKTAFLNNRDLSVPSSSQGLSDVNFLQTGGSVVPRISDNTVDFNQTVTTLQGSITGVRIEIDHNGVSQSDTVDNSVSSGDTFSQSIDVTGLDKAFPLGIKFTVFYSNDTNQIFQSSYGIATTGINLLDQLILARDSEFGRTGSAMLAVLLTALMVGVTGIKSGDLVRNGSVFFAMAILLFFLVVGFISWQSFLFGGIAGTLIYWGTTRQGAI